MFSFLRPVFKFDELSWNITKSQNVFLTVKQCQVHCSLSDLWYQEECVGLKLVLCTFYWIALFALFCIRVCFFLSKISVYDFVFLSLDNVIPYYLVLIGLAACTHARFLSKILTYPIGIASTPTKFKLLSTSIIGHAWYLFGPLLTYQNTSMTWDFIWLSKKLLQTDILVSPPDDWLEIAIYW